MAPTARSPAQAPTGSRTANVRQPAAGPVSGIVAGPSMTCSSVAPLAAVSRMSPVLAWAMLNSAPALPAVSSRPPFSRQP